jgi:2-oxo-3-hexenedioate decarboxylase
MIADDRALERVVRRLEGARAARAPVERMMTGGNATLADGYVLQRALMKRAAARGAGLRGFKVGTTSAAAMARVGIDEPLYGFLERDDGVANGGVVDSAALIAPRIEMELAFVTGGDLSGAACDAETALAATAYVVPALEIIDSRYAAGAFDVVAAVADNMSTARHVLGEQRLDPREVDLRAVTATLEQDGREVARGSGAAVLGDPARSLAWLVRALARSGLSLPAGSVVLTGGLAGALPAPPGAAFVARFVPGGTVACAFSPAVDAHG